MFALTPRAGGGLCRIFLTLLACATLAAHNKIQRARSQLKRRAILPEYGGRGTLSILDKKHIHLGAIDTPFPQSPVFPSAAATNSAASGAWSQDHPSSESKASWCSLPFLLESNANLNHPGRTIPLSGEQRRLDFAALFRRRRRYGGRWHLLGHRRRRQILSAQRSLSDRCIRRARHRCLRSVRRRHRQWQRRSLSSHSARRQLGSWRILGQDLRQGLRWPALQLSRPHREFEPQ